MLTLWRRPSPAWRVVLILSVTELASWAVLYYAFTVFVTPMHQSLGWSVPTVTGAFSLALVCNGVAGLGIGYLVDRQGVRGVMTIGSAAAVLLLVAWSQTASIGAYYLIWAGLGAAMAAVLYEPAFAAVAVWHPRDLSRALTVLTLVAGFAAVVAVPGAQALVGRWGWRDAVLVLAVGLACVTIPLHALLPPSPPAAAASSPTPVPGDEAPTAPDGVGAALGDARFWRLTLSFAGATLVSTIVAVYWMPVWIGRGLPATVAARTYALWGLCSLPGRVVFTPLGRRVSRHALTAAIFVLQAGAMALFATAHSAALAAVIAVTYGLGYGAITPARAALFAQAYGAHRFGRLTGVVNFFLTAVRAGGPLAAGLAAKLSGTYTGVFVALAAVLLLSSLSLMAARGSPS